MERCWHFGIQHLSLVDDWLEDENLVCFSILFKTEMAFPSFIFFPKKFDNNTWFVPQIFRLGSFDDEVKEIVELSTEDAYGMAMKSMLRWVRLNMDPKKTRVFFTSMSPSHGKWV